jgi:hypothetical protein
MVQFCRTLIMSAFAASSVLALSDQPSTVGSLSLQATLENTTQQIFPISTKTTTHAVATVGVLRRRSEPPLPPSYHPKAVIVAGTSKPKNDQGGEDKQKSKHHDGDANSSGGSLSLRDTNPLVGLWQGGAAKLALGFVAIVMVLAA